VITGSLDGRRFRSDRGVVADVREHDGVVWADLHSGDVLHGHATGIRRGDHIEYGYVLTRAGGVSTGGGVLRGDASLHEIGLAGTVLFVCTGNFYRSRFAELLFESRADAAGLDWRAESRGLRAWAHGARGRMSPHTFEALQARGVRVPHRAMRSPHLATPTDLEAASLVIALHEQEHRPLVEQYLDCFVDRFVFWSVPDVDEVDPAAALPEIERRVDALVAELAVPLL
jgi:protein-tyrosine phosphatase